ncbi:hypothetical protein C8Q78DRAFT_809999 [Trametes maxima]|nr:hypothetical protein C8Q78DRAFT_809999 [Trametes maxima]
MHSVHDPSRGDYPPLPKRPRVSNPPPPSAFLAPQPGPSAAPVPDQDGAADAASKKNRKRPLSCGECRRCVSSSPTPLAPHSRRSSLQTQAQGALAPARVVFRRRQSHTPSQCDRVFPCQSCCKRGCAEICPDGSLTGGKGSRFILANTEQLHEKIKAMSGRIRELEEALNEVQPAHHLLREDLLLIKKSADLFGVDPQPLQVPGAEGSRLADFQQPGPSSGSPLRDDRQSLSPSYHNGHSDDYGIPLDILQVSEKFPAPSAITFELNPDLRQRIVEMLPPQAEARYLCEQAAEHAAWHQNSDGSDGVPNMVHSVYNCSVATLNPHRLSYFLIILAIGVCVDQRRSHRTWVRDAERYHHLSRAALCETSVIDEPSIDAINSLFYMSRYLTMFNVEKKEAIEYAWTVMGIASKLAVGIGLHRNVSRSKVIPEELDKRKTLLWCMLNVDHRLVRASRVLSMCPVPWLTYFLVPPRQALMLRRPPSIALRYVDVDPPTAVEFPPQGPREVYQRWHYTFTAQCLSPILEAVVSPNPPPYPEVLHIDARVRDFELPAYMQQPPAPSSGNALCLVQLYTVVTREVALLNLHRHYFTQALSEGLWANHKYACSVVAVYQAALHVLWSLETYYRQQPEYSVRSQILWFDGLSAAMALSLLLCRAPPSVMTSNALIEFAKVLRLYKDVSDRCPTALKALPILENLFDRSRAHYLQSRYGAPNECEPDDEVCKIAARAGIAPSPAPASKRSPGSPDVAPFPFGGAHPALVRAFDEALATTPPPNDPILMPGPVPTASAGAGSLGMGMSMGMSMGMGGPGGMGMGMGMGIGVDRNGQGATTGFGVSAERSGCQADAHLPMNGGAGTPPASGLGQNLKWLSQEYSDSGWMTWF